jgi:UDP-N-acetylmuramoyl-tripeptide--D-alanyl-D-alanine ligase
MIVEESFGRDISVAQVVVEDTFLALQTLAKRLYCDVPDSVRGNYGEQRKTTTKDVIASVLSDKYNVLKTQEI